MARPATMFCPVCSSHKIVAHCPNKERCRWWRCKNCTSYGDGKRYVNARGGRA